MTVHLSTRLVWHDQGWNGCICRHPKLNVSCMVNKHVREGRDDKFEETHANKHVKEIAIDDLPPCSGDIGAFSSQKFTIIHNDPLDNRSLPSVDEEIPPYSFCASPYGRMLSEDPNRTWVDPRDAKEQLRRLDDFWSEVEEGKSLVFFYVNHGNPLKEEKSDRILVGVGRISKIHPQLYFGKKRGWPDDCPVWSRTVTHNFPEEGVRLPYQEYIEAGLDPSNIVCTIPQSARPFFLYVNEHVSDDIAVGILERVLQSVKTVISEGKVSEPYGKTWGSRVEWLNKVLGEVWKGRGRFPGVGSILEYLGFAGGVAYHKTVLSSLEKDGENILKYILSILEKERKPPEEYRLAFRKAIRKWNSLPPKRRELLKVLSHFELSPAQVDRVCNPTKRRSAGIESSEEDMINNPYVLSELDQGGLDERKDHSPPIDFETIDRGMIPAEDMGRIEGEIEPIDKDDKRRVRALFVDILKRASQEGDTCLTLDEAFKRIHNRLPENRSCDLDLDIVLYNRKFYEEMIEFFPAENPQVVSLKSIRQMEKEISERLKKMVKKEYERAEKGFWKNLIDEELKDVKIIDEEVERRAREEKVAALEKLFSYRFSILTGRAGTGKTTVLKIFVRGLEKKLGRQPILLLAPTGKARVRLQEITGKEAQTIHQFLMKLGWIKRDTYSLREKGGEKQGIPVVIIDEASMVPLDLLATLFRAIDFNGVKRLILVGDSNQLPPIGPGRPFVDIIKWLESSEEKEKHIARLTQRVRYQEVKGEALKLSDAFLCGETSPGDDEIISRVARGEVSGDLEVLFWNDEKELWQLLDKAMIKELGFDPNKDPDYEGFDKSVRKPDKWQILSPTRIQVFGTTEINRITQRKYRGKIVEKARKGKLKPFGDQQIVQGDKVIQIVNSWRKRIIKGEEREGYVANGEVGLAVKTYKAGTWWHRGRLISSPDRIEISFSTQPDSRYRYRRGEVNENLELAYAITVHKSQGSDFDKVFLILPQKARTMSREMLYTGLTRFKKKIILLIEKDVTPLITFRNPQYSEILGRNTNLFELATRPETIGLPHPERLIHRTTTGILVRSKSEVIVANILTELGISYKYENPLYSKSNPKDFRLPDFTIEYEGEEFYWEHLGMLEDPEYRKDWEKKERWYKENGYYDRLIVSQDGPDGRIDSQEIKELAKKRILMAN